MIKAFIFDLDGVITDTAEFHYLAWKQLCDDQAWTFTREINENLRGVSRVDSLKLIAKANQFELSEEEISQFGAIKNKIYVDSLSQLSPKDYLSGAKELLIDLKKEGFKVALGSASKNSMKVLQQLDALDYFDVIGDGNSVTRSKPAPDIFLYSAKELGLDPSECLVVEDAESGVDAALAGGFPCIGIGPSERVDHATLRYEVMGDIYLSDIKKRLKSLFS